MRKFFIILLSIACVIQQAWGGEKKDTKAINLAFVSSTILAGMHTLAVEFACQSGARYASPSFFMKDGVYLGGRLASVSLPSVFLLYSNFNDKKTRRYGKGLYFSSLLYSFWVGGKKDAIMWDSQKRFHNSRLEGAVSFTLPLLAMKYWSPKSRTESVCTTFAGILWGSVIWDLKFSQMRYGQKFYPVPNWYGGWGFKTKQERIKFDIIRFGAGLFFYFLPKFIN